MPDNEPKEGKLTRRQVLKGAAAVVGGVALAGGLKNLVETATRGPDVLPAALYALASEVDDPTAQVILAKLKKPNPKVQVVTMKLVGQEPDPNPENVVLDQDTGKKRRLGRESRVTTAYFALEHDPVKNTDRIYMYDPQDQENGLVLLKPRPADGSPGSVYWKPENGNTQGSPVFEYRARDERIGRDSEFDYYPPFFSRFPDSQPGKVSKVVVRDTFSPFKRVLSLGKE